MQRLLDIHLLIALCDPNHVDHRRVTSWFAETGGEAWASCPITENGLVRILSNPTYPGLSGSVSLAIELLRKLTRHQGHHFWPDDYSICKGPADLRRIAGHKQITDLYLLGLAVRRKAKFSSLDRHLPAQVIQGGPQSYEIV